jgi:hypothetical protein
MFLPESPLIVGAWGVHPALYGRIAVDLCELEKTLKTRQV